MSLASTIAELKRARERDMEREREQQHAQRMRNWRRANPNATPAEMYAAEQRIRKEVEL